MVSKMSLLIFTLIIVGTQGTCELFIIIRISSGLALNMIIFSFKVNLRAQLIRHVEERSNQACSTRMKIHHFESFQFWVSPQASTTCRSSCIQMEYDSSIPYPQFECTLHLTNVRFEYIFADVIAL